MTEATGEQIDRHVIVHASAFELVEIFIYGYVIYGLITKMWSQYKSATSSETAAYIYGIIFVVFLIVIIQNFLFMRIADEKYFGRHRGYKFVEKNSNPFRFFERLFRLLTVSAVLLTPKYPAEDSEFGIVSGVVSIFSYCLRFLILSIEEIFQNFQIFFLKSELSHFDRSQSAGIQGYISYYSGAIFLILILNISWDLINLAAVRKRKINQGTGYFRYKSVSPRESDIFSFFNYIGLVASKFEKGKNTFQYTDYIQKPSRDTSKYVEKTVLSGNIWKFYFLHSPLFRARISVLFFCIFTMACSIYNSPTVFVFFMGFTAALFGFYTSRGEHLMHRIWEIGLMPIRYLTNKSY